MMDSRIILYPPGRVRHHGRGGHALHWQDQLSAVPRSCKAAAVSGRHSADPVSYTHLEAPTQDEHGDARTQDEHDAAHGGRAGLGLVPRGSVLPDLLAGLQYEFWY